MSNLIEHLIFRARISPQAIAVQGHEKSVTYKQLLLIVKGVAKKIRDLGIQPQEVVLTCISGMYWEYILTLAMLHEGVVGCAGHSYKIEGISIEPDWVISDQMPEAYPSEKVIIINGEWFKSAAEFSQVELDYYKASSSVEISRMTLTSGTTGLRKAVAFTNQMLELRAKSYKTQWANIGRECNMMRLSTAGGFNSMLSNLISGQPYYAYSNPAQMVKLINQHHLQFLAGSPGQLSGFIEFVVSNKITLKRLNAVRYGGGGVSEVFLKRCWDTLSDRVLGAYGSTETGNTCNFIYQKDVIRKNIGGFALPSVNIRITDDDLIELPQGEHGRISIRSPYMASAYLNNPEQSEKFFKQGWFYPGDTGFIQKDGLVILVARNDEIVNVRGMKINLAQIDEYLQQYPKLQEGAAFAYKDRDGLQAYGVAIVPKVDLKIEELKAYMDQQSGPERAPRGIFFIKKIPRNTMSKIVRSEIEKLYYQSLT
ncbi:long-chain fatty acid--CoA ligase [Polynucleobacter paneuropaeus]|nr:long-chain fatty acid--CoA ligase [Polynucleobacter paneuropaeus]